MTTIEICNRLEPHENVGFLFAEKRETLERLFTKPSIHNNEYENAVRDYINAAQMYLFESDLERRYHVVNNAGLVIKNEVQLICGFSVDCVADVQGRVEAYCNDETALSYKGLYHSPLPRAFTMVMLDYLLDEVRPSTYE